MSSTSEHLKARFSKVILDTHAYRGDETVVLAREGLLDVCRTLKEDPSFGFTLLVDLSAVDYLTFDRPASPPIGSVSPSPFPGFMLPTTDPPSQAWPKTCHPPARFEVVYHLYALASGRRLRVKVPVTADDPVVPSLTPLWKGANWFEREVWDMFGIRFAGHPDLRRILLYDTFQGHPLRKDYPVNKRQPLIGPVN